MLERALESGLLEISENISTLNASIDRDPQLEAGLKEFNLLSLACSDTNEDRGYGELFENCPICGHHDCFVIYENGAGPESFFCFGANGNLGGTAIDYLMHTRRFNKREAINHVLGDKGEVDSLNYASKSIAALRSENELTPFLDGLTAEDINDMFLARMFAQTYKDKICFVDEWRCFAFYDGIIWRRDISAQRVKMLCKLFIDDLLKQCMEIPNEATKKSLLDKLRQYLRENRRSHLIKDAASECLVSVEIFDRDSTLLVLINRTINLTTGEIREHHPEDMVTKYAPIIYDASATCPLWEKVLLENQFGDLDTVKYIQKIFGKALAGDTSDEELYIFGFETRSGKGLITGTIETMLGTGENGYACNSQGDVFEMPKRGSSSSARGNIARMQAKRLVIAQEPPKDMKLDAPIVKQLTGNDLVTAREIYEKDKSFKPQAIIIISTNHMPLIDDQTVTASGRIKVVPFDNHLPVCEQDPTLKKEMVKPENLSGILNWCLEGYRLYKIEGINPPERVRLKTLDYILKSDWVRSFIEECMLDDAGSKIRVKDLYQSFLVWGKGKDGFPKIAEKHFREDLEMCGITIKAKSRIDGKDNRNVVIGKKIKPDSN